MLEQDRIARGGRAQAALDEFIRPVSARMEADALESLARRATSWLWRAGPIRREALRLKVVREVVASIEAAVLDGQMAQRETEAKATRAAMSPARRNALR